MNILKLQELSRKRLEALSPEYLELRKRDTMEQERIKIEDLDAYFEKKFEW